MKRYSFCSTDVRQLTSKGDRAVQSDRGSIAPTSIDTCVYHLVWACLVFRRLVSLVSFRFKTPTSAFRGVFWDMCAAFDDVASTQCTSPYPALFGEELAKTCTIRVFPALRWFSFRNTHMSAVLAQSVTPCWVLIGHGLFHILIIYVLVLYEHTSQEICLKVCCFFSYK